MMEPEVYLPQTSVHEEAMAVLRAQKNVNRYDPELGSEV
jgi:hypothetical protein